jgi:hypothetical protein
MLRVAASRHNKAVWQLSFQEKSGLIPVAFQVNKGPAIGKNREIYR